MRMLMTIEFDRPVTGEEYYIMPGGYEVIAAGKNYQFDFLETCGCIDHMNPKRVCFQAEGADLASFPEMEELKKHLHEITEIVEFYVYTGEYDEPEIIPVTAMNIEIDAMDAEHCVPETETDFVITKRCDDIIYCFFKNPIELDVS